MMLDQPRPFHASTSAVRSSLRCAIALIVSPGCTVWLGGAATVFTCSGMRGDTAGRSVVAAMAVAAAAGALPRASETDPMTAVAAVATAMCDRIGAVVGLKSCPFVDPATLARRHSYVNKCETELMKWLV